MATVTRDATSNIYTPSSSAEWATTAAVAGVSAPSNLWLMQEASGNFADSIGSVTLTAALISAYQQSLSGWSRKFATTATQGGGRGAVAVGGTLAPLSTTSQMSLMLFARTAVVSAERDVTRVGFTTVEGLWSTITTSHFIKGKGPTGNVATGAVAIPINTVIPVIVQHDKTNSAQRIITADEVVTPTFAAAVGTDASIAFGDCGSGGSGGACPPGAFGYFCSWQGAAAEMTTAKIKTLLTTLGWSVAW